MGDTVTINVYLPDEIGERAKEAGLNFSRMLRGAVEAELQRRDTIAATLKDGLEEVEVDLGEHTGYFTGKALADTTSDGLDVYLTDDERVIVYDGSRLEAIVLDDPANELPDWVRDPHELTMISIELGIKPRIRL
jgi:hypothetical protein